MKVMDIRGSLTPLIETREPTYIALENTDLDLKFSKKEVLKINQYLDAGLNVWQIRSIADELGRLQEEVFLMMLDRKACDQVALTSGIGEYYYALESVDMDWFWEMKDVEEVWKLNKENLDFWEISKRIGRHFVDVIVLLVDLNRKEGVGSNLL